VASQKRSLPLFPDVDLPFFRIVAHDTSRRLTRILDCKSRATSTRRAAGRWGG